MSFFTLQCIRARFESRSDHFWCCCCHKRFFFIYFCRTYFTDKRHDLLRCCVEVISVCSLFSTTRRENTTESRGNKSVVEDTRRGGGAELKGLPSRSAEGGGRGLSEARYRNSIIIKLNWEQRRRLTCRWTLPGESGAGHYLVLILLLDTFGGSWTWILAACLAGIIHWMRPQQKTARFFFGVWPVNGSSADGAQNWTTCDDESTLISPNTHTFRGTITWWTNSIEQDL